MAKKKLTNEEQLALYYLAKDGDISARNTLVVNAIPVYYVVLNRKYGIRRERFESEIMSEITFVIDKCIKLYDPSFQVPFLLYILNFTNRLFEFSCKNFNENNEEISDNFDVTHQNHSDLDKEQNKKTIDAWFKKKRLSEQKKEIYLLHLENYKTDEIADRFNLSRQRIQQTIAEVREALGIERQSVNKSDYHTEYYKKNREKRLAVKKEKLKKSKEKTELTKN